MRFPLQFLKTIKTKKILSTIIFVSIAVVILLAYFFLERKISSNMLILFLFGFLIAQIFVLQYFFKNQLRNEIRLANLNTRIKELKSSLEETNKLADFKSVYIANMSYEIRTPLSTVLGMLNMLKETHLDADQKAQVEIAEYSSKHLLQLVNMVTDNEDVDKGDVKLNLLALDLKTDLSHLFKVFEYQAWEKGLQFDYKFLVDEKRKFSLLGDSLRIQQVLINLINNAIKFTNSGKISIIVDQTVSIEDGQIVTFYIKDTGIGLRPEEVKQIFNDSKAFSISQGRDYRGGGIGLAISHQLVKLMGGELKLESKENEGTTFYFSLQLKKTLGIKKEEDIEEPILLEKFNVLVAEDNRMNQKVIKFLLEQQGADCTFVKNGLEAVELYKILNFDMIFMDIYMPDMDGYEATKAIKETEKYSQYNTPIIAVSASAFEADIVNAKLAGIDDFLAKPLEVSKLKELLIKYSKKNVS
ncbi:Sensory/regulatory protein RpfC [Mariniflexile rhizosphaerae]|uniref:ATP-binding protein n=1 Tax=unclassified Mariniflexile TaxID=2643887 RepID=UPI000E330A1E|nr:ATP-binding protein [Mariniflexile sp. TRM1-10]AXP82327.1 Sensory/regulatory protein RpfC [Mariniflexile sp. TRM1-10]